MVMCVIADHYEDSQAGGEHSGARLVRVVTSTGLVGYMVRGVLIEVHRNV